MRSEVIAILLAASVGASPGSGGTPSLPAERGAGRGEGQWLQPSADHLWRFPQDHWASPGFKNEWWYFTGHLEAEDGAQFGFQVTLFRIGLLPEVPPLDSAWATRGAVMGHAAIGDLSRGEHHFSEVLWRDAPLLGGFAAFPDPVIAWARAPAGSDGRWTVTWNGAGFDLAFVDRAQGTALRLSTRPEKPLVFQGPNGVSRKSAAEGYASLYTSFTRLAAEGELTVAGARRKVRGLAWMDRERSSSQLAPGQVGWDWFALELADGRDLMLYVLRRADGTADFRSATLVAADGATAWLTPGEWSVRATGRWKSPATGAEYPASWEVEVRGERLRVEPAFAAQENLSRLAGLHYWEGAVRILRPDGAPAGQGYVELTGYGARNRPPL